MQKTSMDQKSKYAHAGLFYVVEALTSGSASFSMFSQVQLQGFVGMFCVYIIMAFISTRYSGGCGSFPSVC